MQKSTKAGKLPGPGQEEATAPPHFERIGQVYVHESDDLSNYPHAIFAHDPRSFQPQARADGVGEVRVFKWGLYDRMDREDDSEEETHALIAKKIKSRANLKVYEQAGLVDPAEQFVQVLIDRKMAAIANNPEIKEACRKTLLTIKVSLLRNEEDCWRIFTVPASTSLPVVHDQILCPVMGWSRGYHGYIFEDNTDGAAIGPKIYSAYSDFRHAHIHFVSVMNDRLVPLAALLRNVGDECFYTYDMGDNWRHRLKVIAVSDDEVGGQSAVQLLDGKGACPPEDSIGIKRLSKHLGAFAYAEFLAQYKARSQSYIMDDVIFEIEFRAPNYSTNWLTSAPIPFRPFEFPIEMHRTMLREMLITPRIVKPTGVRFQLVQEKNECETCKDRMKPLMLCTACERVMYCSKECQKKDWKRHKAACKQHRA